MDKGFLTRLFHKLTGWGAPDIAKTPVKTPLFTPAELRALDEKWRYAPMIRLGDFMDSYQLALESDADGRKQEGRAMMAGIDYFTTLTRLQSKMVKGTLPFAYPKAGVYDYPEKDLFFAEHCFVPVPDLVAFARKMENEGHRENAVIFANALKRAAKDATPEKADNLFWAGYEYENGKTAQVNFYLSAYEAGSSFAPVLRHHKPGGKGPQPGGPR